MSTVQTPHRNPTLATRRTVTFPPTPLRLTTTSRAPNGPTPHLHLPTPTTPRKPPPRTALPPKSILKTRASTLSSTSSHTLHSPLAHAFRRDTNRVRKSLSIKTAAAKAKATNLQKATSEKLKKVLCLVAAEAVGLGCVWKLGQEGLIRSFPSGGEFTSTLVSAGTEVAQNADVRTLLGLGLAWTAVVGMGGVLALTGSEEDRMDEEL